MDLNRQVQQDKSYREHEVLYSEFFYSTTYVFL